MTTNGDKTTTTGEIDNGGHSTSMTSPGTRLVDDRDPVAGVYSNGKIGATSVQLRFVPTGMITAELPGELANRIAAWCADRDGEGVFAVQYHGPDGTCEDRGVYVLESVIGEQTSVRLRFYESTNPDVNRSSSNFWTGHYAEAVCHATGDVVVAGEQRYTRV